MNSKQLNFFIVPEDIPSVDSFFNTQGIKYIRKKDAVNNVIHLESFPYSDGEIYEQIYLTTDAFKSQVYLDTESKWPLTVDIFKSCVLQFSPGGFYPASSKTLYQGGFYCATSYFVSNGESVAKNEHFKKWVDNLFKLFKKEFLSKYDE